MNQADQAKGQKIINALLAVLREGEARERVNPTFTTVWAHILTVSDATAKRLQGVATREEVLEVWLAMHMTLALQSVGEVGEPVPRATGDA